jgi:hypothetical protein
MNTGRCFDSYKDITSFRRGCWLLCRESLKLCTASIVAFLPIFYFEYALTVPPTIDPVGCMRFAPVTPCEHIGEYDSLWPIRIQGPFLPLTTHRLYVGREQVIMDGPLFVSIPVAFGSVAAACPGSSICTTGPSDSLTLRSESEPLWSLVGYGLRLQSAPLDSCSLHCPHTFLV